MDNLFEKIIEVVPEDKREEIKPVFEEIKSGSKVNLDTWKGFANDPENAKTIGDFFKEYAKRPSAQDYVNRIFDSKVTEARDKAIQTFMEKEFPQKLDEEIKRRFPEKSEAEQKLAEMQLKLEQIEYESKRKDLINHAITISDGLFEGFEPERYIGDTNEETEENITKIKESFKKAIDAAVEAKDKEWLEKTGGAPDGAKENHDKIANPFLPDSFSLSVRARLQKENPKLLEKFRKEAIDKGIIGN